eukprot:TRINITY_DN7840_c0_g1::TRINITY_DN7840_c0_g1_i1::g.23790::m.23790 TRINITY_DN7840_c0_g1::TRINITY_DN7840_c0_g1_i1::g.23790  ORF type:complete len:312 (+),score=23.10,sp/Q7Z3D6/GLUCM_HUMAN/35.71/2e-36,DUF4392/PF14336.1/1.2e-84,YjeF_N/PF03853.10/1.9e+03,YjeF_N/PF03853.10/0.097 TRINITY_DN7840_c0_g1_i1:52-987(+)
MDLACARIEEITGRDPGGRGITKLWEQCRGSLKDAAQVLVSSKKIALISGFFIITAGVCENDGPPGIAAIARALFLLEKDVTVISDERNSGIIKAALESSSLHLSANDSVRLLILPDTASDEDISKIICAEDGVTSRFDAILSLERPGRAKDGKYYTMRARDVSEVVAPLDAALLVAQTLPNVLTIGVGDGGNEAGMGNVMNLVEAHVPNGPTIASVVPCHHLIVAGVSNWGGYGICAALELATRHTSSLVPTPEEAKTVYEALRHAGAVDGTKGAPVMMVDGLDYEVHFKLLEEIREVVSKFRSTQEAEA